MNEKVGQTSQGVSAVEDSVGRAARQGESCLVHDDANRKEETGDCVPRHGSGQDSPAGLKDKVRGQDSSMPGGEAGGFWRCDRNVVVTESPASGGQFHRKPTNAEIAPADSPSISGLTTSDIANLNAVFDHGMAPSTATNYRVQWNNFVSWAMTKGLGALPADPAHVAAFLAERIEEHGHRPTTLRVAASAIAFVHRNAGLVDPCGSLEVKNTLRCATRKAGRHQKQAQALTADAMADIESTARKPRLGRGGKLESEEAARRRGNMDIALISLMRDGMLRVSEAADLTWKDVSAEADGTGRLMIRSSKTDAEGKGAIVFLSAKTMAALELVHIEPSQNDTLFGLRPNQIASRIKKAAQAAGLGEGFSGHSPRVGMARDLAREGIELTSLMNAGRWRSATMPAHYTRNELAAKGAVAQYHGYCLGKGRR